MNVHEKGLCLPGWCNECDDLLQYRLIGISSVSNALFSGGDCALLLHHHPELYPKQSINKSDGVLWREQISCDLMRTMVLKSPPLDGLSGFR